MRFASRKIAAYLTSALLVALLVARQIGEARVANDLYQITEWRIFYPGHFIRRGLRGSVLEWLSRVAVIPPETIIRGLCTLAYAALAVVFTAYLFKWLWSRGRGWIPILLLSPVGVFFYQDAILSIDRFDVFFLLLTVCHLEICIRSGEPRSYTALSTALFSTLGVLAVMSHEAFLLLCMPVNILLSARRLSRWDARLLMIHGLPAVAGCFCVFTPVSRSDIAILSHGLGVPMGSVEWYNGPISLFAISPMEQAEVVRNIFSADAVRPFLVTATLFGLIHFTVLRRLVLASDFAEPAWGWSRHEHLWRDLLGISFACTLPMYVVAADYGRWFVMVVATFTLCCARLLEVTKPVKRASILWSLAALLVFFFVPIPLSLKFPGASPQLLTWTGAEVLGHFYAKPGRRPEFGGNVPAPGPGMLR
jgi:hypothetical protein